MKERLKLLRKKKQEKIDNENMKIFTRLYHSKSHINFSKKKRSVPSGLPTGKVPLSKQGNQMRNFDNYFATDENNKYFGMSPSFTESQDNKLMGT